MEVIRRGNVYALRLYRSRGRRVYSADGTMRILGKDYTSYLLIRGIYLEPEYLLLEKSKDSPPKYKIVENKALIKQATELALAFESRERVNDDKNLL